MRHIIQVYLMNSDGLVRANFRVNFSTRISTHVFCNATPSVYDKLKFTMKPDPNSPSFYLYDENNVEADADNGDADVDSNSPSSFSTPPRMVSPEEDGMEVGGGSDEECSTSRQGSKRTRQEREGSDEQEDVLSSTEPVTKKRRTQEPAAQVNNNATSNTTASNTAASQSSEARDYQNLQKLVNWTCNHVMDMNQGLAFKIGDIFTPNTFAQFRNALEKAIQSNAPELVQKLFETGMQNCVPETLDTALTLANSIGAHDVIALLNPNSSSSVTTVSPNLRAPEKDWRKKVNPELDQFDIAHIIDYLTVQKKPAAAYALMFGENNTNWPKDEFKFDIFYSCPENIKTLLIKCGAECAGISHMKLVLFDSDFDQAMFRSGLLGIHLEEQSLLENQNDEERKNNVLFFAAGWGDLEVMRLLLHNGANPAAVDNEGKSVLMVAAEKGHVEIMRQLLTYPIDINATNIDSESALNFAAENGYLSACRLLIEHGARINVTYDDEALFSPAAKGHAEICKLLIEQGADDDDKSIIRNTSLSQLAKDGRLNGCKILLSLGAAINYVNGYGESILCLAAESGNLKLVTYLWNQGVSDNGVTWATSPMIMATKEQKLDIVKFFLAQGVSADLTSGNGETALLHACKQGLVEITSLLLEAGADPNLIHPNFDVPLVLAARCGSIEIIKQLLSFGADLFSDFNAGFKALKIAVGAGRTDIASLLLEAHVPVELIHSKRHEGNLVLAAMRIIHSPKFIPLLNLLLQYGAPLDATDEKGNNALMLAVASKNMQAIWVLQRYGAVIGQKNLAGKNALHIAIDAIDLSASSYFTNIPRAIDSTVDALDRSTAESNPKIANDAPIVGNDALIVGNDALILTLLMAIDQSHPNWLSLRKEAINKAKTPFTRELLLLSWAWPILSQTMNLADLAKNILNRGELARYIQFATTALPAHLSSQRIAYMLSLAGLCPSLISHIRPYIYAIPHIKSQLFGNSPIPHPSIVDSFLAGMALTLEKILIEHDGHWRPFDGALSGNAVFEFFNQVANTELSQLIEHAANHEATNTALVFETLLETCFNFTVTVPTLPHSFPEYTAVPGKLTEALMAKGIYSALAIKIETAWKATWSQFFVKLLISEYSSSSSSASSSSSSSSSSQAQSAVYDPNISFGIVDDNLLDEQANQTPAPTGPIAYLNSPQAQDLLEEFRHQLRLAVDQVGGNILDLPRANTEVSTKSTEIHSDPPPKEILANAATVYSALMFRQLNMLNQFIQSSNTS